MKKIILAFIVILLAGMMLLPACSSEENVTTTPGSTTATQSPGDTSTTTPAGTVTVTVTVTTYPPRTGGGTLRLYGSNPYTLDPAVSSDANSSDYILQIFNGLVRLDENLEPAPDIAASWEISPDLLTYTFHLRPDAVFQDGKKVTAADFKYSWERACNPLTLSPVAAAYLGDIVGAGEVLAGRAEEISGVEAVDDYTLRVTIDAPKSYFLSKLTYPTAMVVDRENADSAGWWREPNGTGPFKLTEWRNNELLVLERNNLYFGEKSGVEKVEFQMLTGLPMNMYEMGDIDVTEVSTIYIDRVTDAAGPFSQELQVSPQLSFSWIGFNTNIPPFDDVNVRKAFTMAVDKDRVIDLTLRNMVDRADGILPPGIPGYNEDLAGLGFNPDAAREALAASKYGGAAGLPPVTLTTSGYGNNVSPILEAFVIQWRENLGAEVTIRQLEPDYYIYNLKEEKDNMFDMGWIADYPHPQDFLDVLFHTGAPSNFAEYSNPAVDAVMDAAGVEPDMEKSLEMYRQAEQMLVDDAAMLPLWFGENYVLVKPYVNGYKLNPMGFAWLADVTLEGD